MNPLERMIDPTIFCCPRHQNVKLLRPDSTAFVCRVCGNVYPMDACCVDFGTSAASLDFVTEAKQWDDQAPQYDAKRVVDCVYMAAVHASLRALQATPTDVILDAGCGTGITTRLLRCKQVVGLDASHGMLQQWSNDRTMSHALAVRGDLGQLPFAAGTFDRVLCHNALQQIPCPAMRLQAVAELARVARREGRVVIAVHCYSVRRRLTGAKKSGATGGHSGGVQFVHRFGVRELRTLLEAVFTKVRLTGAAFPLPYRWKLAGLSRKIEVGCQRLRFMAGGGAMLVAECAGRRLTPSLSDDLKQTRVEACHD